MELRLLRYFLAVAREENITKAANYLNVTQPTLSRQLMNLEEELGVKLLNRGTRRVTLTEEGMLLRKRAEEIVALVDKTESAFLASNELIGGEVFIGGGETYVMELIAVIMKQIQKEHPQIRFCIYSGHAEDVKERLDKGLLDFGLLIDASNIDNYDSIRLPAKDRWGVLMRNDSPLSSHDTVCAKDLWDLPLIIPRQVLQHDILLRRIERNPEQLNIAATYNLIYNASALVKGGVGYALCLDGIINTSGESSLCFRPLEPKYESHLDLVWKKYQVFSKAAELFLKEMQTKLSNQ